MKTASFICSMVLGLIFGSCEQSGTGDKDLALINQIIESHVAHVENEHQLVSYARGGEFADNIKKVILRYVVVRTATVEEAREIMLSAIEDLLQRINESRAIRPYLNNFPFSVSDLTYSLSFKDKDGNDQRIGVTYVSVLKDSLHYSGRSESGKYLPNVHVESYEKALAIIKRDHPELLEKPPVR